MPKDKPKSKADVAKMLGLVVPQKGQVVLKFEALGVNGKREFTEISKAYEYIYKSKHKITLFDGFQTIGKKQFASILVSNEKHFMAFMTGYSVGKNGLKVTR
jgi:hypothetical protein